MTTHPEGHTAPQEGHAMSEMARASFVIPASSSAAAVRHHLFMGCQRNRTSHVLALVMVSVNMLTL